MFASAQAILVWIQKKTRQLLIGRGASNILYRRGFLAGPQTLFRRSTAVYERIFCTVVAKFRLIIVFVQTTRVDSGVPLDAENLTL